MTLTPAEVAERSEQVAPELRPPLPPTPFVRFDAFSDEVGADVLVKCEHLQRTGSFKARGAMSKILTLTDAQRQGGGGDGIDRQSRSRCRQRARYPRWARHRVPAGERLAEQGGRAPPARARDTG